jgi:hypothetical protein
VQIDAVLKQLHQLRTEQPGGGGAVPPKPEHRSASAGSETKFQASGTAEPLAPKPVSSSKPATPAVSSPSAAASSGDVDLAALWQNVLEAVGRVSGFTRSYLVDAHPISFLKNVLTIGFAPEFSDRLGLVNNPKNQALLQTKLQELGHANAQIKLVLLEAAPSTMAPAPTAEPKPAPVAAAVRQPNPAPPPPAVAPQTKKPVATNLSAQDFKDDPLIQKALQVFKGQIVEIRA